MFNQTSWRKIWNACLQENNFWKNTISLQFQVPVETFSISWNNSIELSYRRGENNGETIQYHEMEVPSQKIEKSGLFTENWLILCSHSCETSTCLGTFSTRLLLDSKTLMLSLTSWTIFSLLNLRICLLNYHASKGCLSQESYPRNASKSQKQLEQWKFELFHYPVPIHGSFIQFLVCPSFSDVHGWVWWFPSLCLDASKASGALSYFGCCQEGLFPISYTLF